MRVWEITSDEGIGSLKMNKKLDSKPGPREVLVKVLASSINYRDLLTVENPVPRVAKLPISPNSDCSGVILEVGEFCEGLAIGDRVMGCFFQDWMSGEISTKAMQSALGGSLPGVLGEKVLLRGDAVVKIPDYLDFIEAASLPCAAVTAWHAMCYRRPVNSGDTILILGTGGVSVFAQQFANLLGAKTIVISSSNNKLDQISSLGAGHLINYKENPDWEKAVIEVTNGVGVDHVIEVGGAGTLEKSILAARVGGHIALIGILTGADGKMIPTGIMRKSLTLSGIYVGSKIMFENLVNVMAENKLHPIVNKVFSFYDSQLAFQYFRKADHFGKIVISFE